MTTLTAVEFLSLDGVMQAPGRPDEDPRGGFERGGWASEALARDPEAAHASMGDPCGTGAMLFGRRTYLDLVVTGSAPAIRTHSPRCCARPTPSPP